MATFVLIPGAGSGPWMWHLVVAELERRGHEGVAVDLPCEDAAAGLAEYTDATVAAIGDRKDVVVVAQSLGGFTGPLVCERVPVDLLVMLAAMIPKPGETPGEWWANTGHDEAIRDLIARQGPMRNWGPEGFIDAFLHDVDPALAEESGRHVREQSDGPFGAPWPLDAWPDVPTRVLIGTEDHFFPADFQRRVTRERLGITPDEIATSHMPMLARPAELTERLIAYHAALGADVATASGGE